MTQNLLNGSDTLSRPFFLNPWSDACVFILQVKTLSFDQSGTYLAVGGSEVQ